jgi:dihydrofolate reductase
MEAATMKVSVFIASSLDGYIARPDGDVAWLHEGEPLADGDDAGYGAFVETIDVLVMGRETFTKVLEFDWPYGEKQVVVLSRSVSEVPGHLRDRVRIERAGPQALVEKLAAEGYRHMYLDGGRVIQSFLREGLVDEMTVTTIPVLLGAGRPLFGELARDVRLRLLECRWWENGLVQTKYEVLGG